LVDSETVCLWLVDHSYDRAIYKDSVLSIAKVRFYKWIQIQYSC